MSSNFLDLIRTDESFMGEFLDYCNRAKKRLERERHDAAEKGQGSFVPWIPAPEFSNVVFQRVIESVMVRVTPSHRSMFMGKLCESRGLFVLKRQRIGGRPTTAIFADRKAYIEFIRNRPPARTGRSPDHAKYDAERELVPSIRSDGNLILDHKSP